MSPYQNLLFIIFIICFCIIILTSIEFYVIIHFIREKRKRDKKERVEKKKGIE